MPGIQQFFPFGSAYSTWETWNGNFIMFYGEEPIPFTEEELWRDTARNIIGLPTFSAYAIPDPELFETWQEWAEALTLVLNGPSS